MRVLSFDIGVANLAFCEMESHTANERIIKAWDIIQLREKNKKIDFDEMMRRLLVALKERWPSPDMDVVLLENQPCMKNPVMKSIQVYIYAYFSMTGTTRAQLYSASNKLKVSRNNLIPPHKKQSDVSYGERKKMAIAVTRLYINNNADWLLFFEREKKKDDYADCYLQAVHYLENVPTSWIFKKNLNSFFLFRLLVV